ncbi:beta-ketoacyl synthase N-terminal-like domain-containing protein [Dyadobacter sp. 32]|uniref:beta-ketoacyl synthase N-terminal-like domain-containing protein n=1 Tax=Dyadobacter sp. 32 TaxID=538966 RepID=UPI0011ECFDCF
MINTYIGAEVIISPLGKNLVENFAATRENRSGISLVEGAGFNKNAIYLSQISAVHTFQSLIADALMQVKAEIDPEIFSSERTILIISSTKGALAQDINDQFSSSVAFIRREFALKNQPLVISNACVSGVLSINVACNLIKSGIYDHAIVAGCDLLSDFVIYGFQSLFAMSDQPCAPFDAERNGITMGEGCSAVVVSGSYDIFSQAPLNLLQGTTANDANHISGPSRTGEGLYRTVKKTLEMNGLAVKDIDFISAHGTATIYNDEMESVAFDRLGLNQVPMNSMKGYFGHTLGAAGVIETAISMSMMREGVLIKSLGFKQQGTSKELNIIQQNTTAELNTILKTASGFGGGNASLVIQKR